MTTPGTDDYRAPSEFGPGAQTPWHFHNCEESVMLLEGRAVFDIGEAHHDLVV